MTFFRALIKFSLEGVAFLVLTIILFNEFATLMQILGFFSQQSIPQIGLISVIFASFNVASRNFFGIEIK